MSLIDDALRRAAAETARKEAARQGVPVDWSPPPPLPAQRRQAGAIGLAAGGVAVAVLLTVLFWPRRAPERAASAVPAPARSVLPTRSPIPAREAFRAASFPAFSPDTEELAPIASAAEASIEASAMTPPLTPSPAAEPETRIAAVPAPEQEGFSTPDPSMVEEVPAAETEEELFDNERVGPPRGLDFPELDFPEEASASPGIVRRPAPSRTLIRESASRAPAPPPRGAGAAPASPPPVAGGTASASGKLELGGIVFSEGNPVALINGRVVSAGSYVDGYEILRVEATRVELRAQDGKKVVLQLK